MPALHYSLAIIFGAILMTFAGLSFILFPRPVSFANPDLLVELMFVAGACTIALGARGMASISRATKKATLRA